MSRSLCRSDVNFQSLSFFYYFEGPVVFFRFTYSLQCSLSDWRQPNVHCSIGLLAPVVTNMVSSPKQTTDCFSHAGTKWFIRQPMLSIFFCRFTLSPPAFYSRRRNSWPHPSWSHHRKPPSGLRTCTLSTWRDRRFSMGCPLRCLPARRWRLSVAVGPGRCSPELAPQPAPEVLWGCPQLGKPSSKRFSCGLCPVLLWFNPLQFLKL